MKKLLVALLMLAIFIVGGCAGNTKTKKVDAKYVVQQTEAITLA